MRESALNEKAVAAAVWTAIKAKTKIDMKVKKKAGKKKKRILPTAKQGGVLPILPILGALGSLIGGTASVAKAVNDKKAAQLD
ncbi:hypothetical protein P5V15_002660 [Pogonomyrmex californicus]